jgi:hypothetical protein
MLSIQNHRLVKDLTRHDGRLWNQLELRLNFPQFHQQGHNAHSQGATQISPRTLGHASQSKHGRTSQGAHPGGNQRYVAPAGTPNKGHGDDAVHHVKVDIVGTTWLIPPGFICGWKSIATAARDEAGDVFPRRITFSYPGGTLQYQNQTETHGTHQFSEWGSQDREPQTIDASNADHNGRGDG